ncbi:hypothetical protein C3Y87_09835 [Carbonactinospora thermoautotrophica]|nr:hypothetical protein [Carbonactinospora thermoautotrophica]
MAMTAFRPVSRWNGGPIVATFEAILEKVNAEQSPPIETAFGSTLSWSAPCPACHEPDALGLVPHADGKASIWCMTGHCSADDLIAALDLPNVAIVERDHREIVVHHDQRVSQTVRSSSWSPVDVTAVLAGDADPERTEILVRTDGIGLLYPARLHWLQGESESGKSWVALLAAAEVMSAGESALFVDFESDAATVVGRLRQLGVPVEVIRERLTYVRPVERPEPGTDAKRDFNELLTSRRYRIAVIDGVTDALAIWGLDQNNAGDVATFVRALPRRIQDATGAAVVMIDHVVKSNDARGRFAIGSQHKLAALDGVAYVVEPAEPIAPGKRGVIVLRVAKDRPGFVRAHSGAYRSSDRTQEAARVMLDSRDAETTRYEVGIPASLDAETGEIKPWRPTVLMERISRFLELEPRSSGRRIREEVAGSAQAITQALAFLVEDGYVRAENRAGKGAGKVYSVIKPYREDDNGDDAELFHVGAMKLRVPGAGDSDETAFLSVSGSSN